MTLRLKLSLTCGGYIGIWELSCLHKPYIIMTLHFYFQPCLSLFSDAQVVKFSDFLRNMCCLSSHSCRVLNVIILVLWCRNSPFFSAQGQILVEMASALHGVW